MTFLYLTSPSQIEAGKTYYKHPNLCFPLIGLPKIKIVSIEAGVVTAQMGDDTLVQTIFETEAYSYINYNGGYRNTP